jgi:hypothetical protein
VPLRMDRRQGTRPGRAVVQLLERLPCPICRSAMSTVVHAHLGAPLECIDRPFLTQRRAAGRSLGSRAVQDVRGPIRGLVSVTR